MKRKTIQVTERNLPSVWEKLHYAKRKGETIHTNIESADWLDGVHRTYTDIGALVEGLAKNECVIPSNIKKEILSEYQPNEINHPFSFEIGIDDPHDAFSHLQLV